MFIVGSIPKKESIFVSLEGNLNNEVKFPCIFFVLNAPLPMNSIIILREM